jgi:hypothetical protein
MGVSGQHHTTATLIPSQGPLAPTGQEAGWPQSWSGHRGWRKNPFTARDWTPVTKSVVRHYSTIQLLRSGNLHFPAASDIFSGPFDFPIFIMHCLPWFYVSEISSFQQFTSLEHLQRNISDIKWHPLRELPRFTSLEPLQREQFWHKMVSAERLPVSTRSVTYCYHHLLVSHSTETNMYISL